MTINKFTSEQEYENNIERPSELVFYKNENDIADIARNCSETIKENILILEELLKSDFLDIYGLKITTDKGILYALKYE